MRQIAIVGAGGFIGSHLCETLLKDPQYKVLGCDLQSHKISHLLSNSRLRYENIDVRNTAAIENFISDADTVVALAAFCNPALYNTIPVAVIQSNFLEPLHLIDFCTKSRKKLIYFSTCEVYGKTIQGICENRLTHPDDPVNFILQEDETPTILGPVSAERWSYATAKLLTERMIYACGTHHGLDYTIIRPFNFIGPRMDYIPGVDGEGTPRVIACFMHALLRNEPMQLVNEGNNRRVFTAIDDAVCAVLKVLENPDNSHNQIFNIGNPENEISIAELASAMASIYHRILPNTPIPRIKSVTGEGFYGKGYEDCDRRVPDISKAVHLLGWHPNTPLIDALTLTVQSFIDEYAGRSNA